MYGIAYGAGIHLFEMLTKQSRTPKGEPCQAHNRSTKPSARHSGKAPNHTKHPEQNL
jgi:hypothetical protein